MKFWIMKQGELRTHGKTAELAVMSELFVNKNSKYDISGNFIISNKKIKTFHFKIKYIMQCMYKFLKSDSIVWIV